jgi:2-polyprenyl-6-methoxyphenol hydroxylase-like FAD-dependent oxidoreductase
MSEKEKPKAVVVGGSIAGVSCAHALISAGWDVVVLEKSCAPITGSPTGAGLGLDPLAQTLIQSWLQQPELLHNSTLPLTVDLVQPMAPKKKKKLYFASNFVTMFTLNNFRKLKDFKKSKFS